MVLDLQAITRRVMFGLGLFVLSAPAVARAAAEQPGELLARINTSEPFSALPLPAYALLKDAAGQDYVLVKATAPELLQSGLSYQVLDTGSEAATYILAREFRAGARLSAQNQFRVVLDDGKRLVIRASAADEMARLVDLGFQCSRLRAAPIGLTPGAQAVISGAQKAAVTSNAWVSEMIGRVRQPDLYTSLAELTGAQPVVAGGSYSNITTRNQDFSAALRRATDLAYEQFDALGLQPSVQSWSAYGYTDRNVIGTLPGTTAASEIVIVCAHIDDAPFASLAPGADDNASGAVAVLKAAEILRAFSFSRTLRFVLFTGEEPGLLGSEAYANAAYAAGDNIVAVLNLDMLAWDGNGDKILNLYVRPSSSAELNIAAAFTNVVSTYGLKTGLTAQIIKESTDWSDHASFHTCGYPAICVIEEDVVDFNPYYHTKNDTLSRISLPYYTKAVQAVAGTAAHLASPAQRLVFDAIKIQSGTFQTNTAVGVGTFVARHEASAADGSDARDVTCSAMSSNPNPAWLKVYTDPYSSELAIDARPAGSETLFRGKLAAVKTSAGSLTCTNRLKFSFACDRDTNCAYIVKVAVYSNATPNLIGFSCTTNLSQLVAGGGFLDLPGLASVANGAVYGTCEISRRFVSQTSSNLVLGLTQVGASSLTLSTPCQLGVRTEDAIEFTTNLLSASPWLALSPVINEPAPDATSFESGWKPVEMSIPFSSLSPSPSHFFRVKRRWLAP